LSIRCRMVGDMSDKPKLTRTDWIKAAFRALTAGGPQAIKAEVIARDLNMSKGSFYWHFKDVAALKVAMIEHWLEQGTRLVIADLEDRATAPHDRLAQLMRLATSGLTGPYGGPRVEAAIRDWARYEGFVQDAVAGTDRQRLAYVASLLQEGGADASDAEQKSVILYAALIGLEQLSGLSGLKPDVTLLATLDLVLKGLPVAS
jgi:AcrR family transcriptional regulator